MSARACRRRYAILGVLHEHGALYASDIAHITHRMPGSNYADLAWLEQSGRIVAEWNDAPEGQRRQLWRIATGAEREAHGQSGPRRRVVVVDTRQPRMRTAPRPAAAAGGA